VAQLAFLFQRSGLLTARDGIFMAAGTTGMKDHTGFRRFRRFMFMAFMAGLNRCISRLVFVMTGGALGDAKISMHFMSKGHCAQFGIELDHFFIGRYRHLFSHGIADKACK